jgi:hypothetical protein
MVHSFQSRSNKIPINKNHSQNVITVLLKVEGALAEAKENTKEIQIFLSLEVCTLSPV